MWKFLGPVVCGIPCSEISKLPLGNKFPSIIDLFSTQEKKRGCLNDFQVRDWSLITGKGGGIQIGRGGGGAREVLPL